METQQLNQHPPICEHCEVCFPHNPFRTGPNIRGTTATVPCVVTIILAESHEGKDGLTMTTLPRLSLMLCSDTGLRYVSGGYSTSSSSGMVDSQPTKASYSMGGSIWKQCAKRCRHIEMIELARMRCYQAAQPTGRSARRDFLVALQVALAGPTPAPAASLHICC